MDEESTLKMNRSPANVPWIDSGLELLVIDEHGHQSTWPVCRSSMQIGSAQCARPNDIILDGPGVAERQAVLQYKNQKAMFLNFAESQPATKGGQAVTYCALNPGEEILLCGQRLRLVERQKASASLVGYSHPYRGRRWLLAPGNNPVGRPGKRDNHIVIDDRTVSRTHVTIEQTPPGFRLQVDTDSTPTFVNGHPVTGSLDLKDGDLLQLGGQILRFQLGKDTTTMETRRATVLFADIPNYEQLSESRPMDELVRQIGDFYEMVDRVVGEHSGLLATYLGDAVVALFDQEAAAVRTALDLCHNLDSMNVLWQQVHLPTLELEVGIHTGEIVWGDLSLGGRSEFAAVGEQANVAAHIKRQASRKGVRILLSQATAKGLGPDFPLRSLGTAHLDGTPVELFAIA